MTRYFYTKPLASAWMQEEYGMRFIDAVGSEIDDWASELMCGDDTRYYIHPDSLHLLDPRESDVVERDAYSLVGIVRIVQDGKVTIWWGGDDGEQYDAWSDDCRIIQRDGQPFMLPQVEP